MKGFIRLFLLITIFALILGCSNEDGKENENKYYKPSEAFLGKTAFVGDVNKIYIAKTPSAKYITGQILDRIWVGGEIGWLNAPIRFEGNIVEYNSIRQSILSYVESLGSNNARMHQSYETIVFDGSKKYVEFSTYTNIETGEIVAVEIRVFFGNFLETLNTNFWYAKSATFNSDFTRDITVGTPERPVSF